MKLLFSLKGDYELRVNMHDLVEKTLKFYTESFKNQLGHSFSSLPKLSQPKINIS